jgi:ribonuclease-3
MAATFPTFRNQDLLTTALTHRSSLNEKISPSLESNERLEYLGDAVLELVVSDYLFHKFPEEQEGMLTVFRSSLVKTTTLAEVAKELELGERLYMSKGEEASGGRKNTSLLANTFEALLGAVYLDQGIQTVQGLLEELLFPKMEEILQKKLYKHAKSLLQEVLQAEGISTPEYIVVDKAGPDHDRQFTVKVVINGKDAASGVGKSKQLAEEAAAQAVLENETLLNQLISSVK